MIRLAAASVILIGAFVVAAPVSAAVTCNGGVNTDIDSATAQLDCPPPPVRNKPGKPDTRRTSGKAVKPACVWVPKPDYQAGAGEPAEGQGGHWYQKFCSFGDYETLAEFQQAFDGTGDSMDTRQTDMLRRAGLEIRFFTTPPETPRLTPEQAIASAVDEIKFPTTFVKVSPVPAKQVVGIPTWVWLTDEAGKYDAKRYESQTEDVEIDGYQLKWQIVPQLTVSPGTGDDQICAGAGLPWSPEVDGDPSACTATYDRAGEYTLSAGVKWTVRWWLAGVEQAEIPGPTKSAAQPLTVGEIQTHNR